MGWLRMAYRATDDSADDGPLRFTASTPGTKRDGADLAGLPWTLDNFRANPVVTWAHDFMGNRLPIGRADIEIQDRDGGQFLEAAVTFDKADPFAAEVERKYRAGFLHAVSVSWDDVDASGVPTRSGGKSAVAHDLLELAAVPVPGDQDALIARARAYLAELAGGAETGADADAPDERAHRDGGDAEPVTDTHTDDEDTAQGTAWPDVAGDMLAVFAPDCPDDDRTRRRRYNALLARYRVLGRTPPEFLSAAEVDALGVDEWRGLWLEGELDGSRVGAVLNTRNKELLSGARDAITTVLKSSEGGDEPGRSATRAMEPDAVAAKLDAIVAALADLKAALTGDSADAAPADAAPTDGAASADDAEAERAADDDLTDDDLAGLAADLDALVA